MAKDGWPAAACSRVRGLLSHAVIAGAFTVLAFTSQDAQAAPFYGVNVGYAFSQAPAERDHQLDLMASSGVTVVRHDAAWGGVEPHAPDGAHHYDWQNTDRTAATLAAHGLTWYPVLDYSAPWAATIPGDQMSGAAPGDDRRLRRLHGSVRSPLRPRRRLLGRALRGSQASRRGLRARQRAQHIHVLARAGDGSRGLRRRVRRRAHGHQGRRCHDAGRLGRPARRQRDEPERVPAPDGAPPALAAQRHRRGRIPPVPDELRRDAFRHQGDAEHDDVARDGLRPHRDHGSRHDDRVGLRVDPCRRRSASSLAICRPRRH